MSLENYYLYRLAIWLVTHLPHWLLYGSAALFSELNFLINKRLRRGIYANQHHVLPPETGPIQRWRAARAAFRNSGYSFIDFLRIPSMTPDNISRFVSELRGREHIESAMAAGKGGIFVTVHMGSWEMGGAYLGMSGVPLTAVALPHRDPRIDQIFTESRRVAGMETVPVGGALRKLQKALLQGRFIALVADRDVSGHGLRLPFFGANTRVPKGHAMLALHTGAWILPGCAYRTSDGRVVVEIRQPIIPDREADTVESLTLRCLGILEDFIRARPEQWASFYDLWNETELPVA